MKSTLFDSEFLKKIEKLVITSRMMLAEGAGGNRKSRSKGSSVEFSDYREYSLGDDFRRIDWNAYGRFEKLFVKLFMEEREAPVHIFLDISRSMDWGEPNKSYASRRLAAALSYISLTNFDRLSIVCADNKADKMQLSLRGKNSFGQVLGFLENLNYQNPTDFYKAVEGYPLKAGRGISIIISDLFSPGEFIDMVNYLQYKKQEVYVCHMLSPQEIEPEINASLRLVDIETGEFRDITATAGLIKNYQGVYQNFISGLVETCYKRGVHYINMPSSIPVEQMIKMVVNTQ